MPTQEIIEGDCIEVLSSMQPASIDVIFADPPYLFSGDGLTVGNSNYVALDKGDWDKDKGFESNLEFQGRWIEACHRVLKPAGTIWITGTYHSIYQCGFHLQRLKFFILNEISWYKPNATPNLSCRRFTSSHETLIWALKEKEQKKNYTFNYDAMKAYRNQKDILKMPNKQMRSVWCILPVSKHEKKLGNHPTQKPLELLNRIILSSSNENDLVLDPFTGSGTTGVICKEHRRNFIGIELEAKYAKLARDRIADWQL